MPNYTTKPKENWRGWVWNRLIEKHNENIRLHPHLIPQGLTPQDRIALYLLGPNPIDAQAAIHRKALKHNIIGIDTKKEHIKHARQQGYLAIQGNLEEIIMLWKTPITIINADFTCGLNKTIERFLTAIALSPSIIAGYTTIAVNIQRGRDAHSNHYRKLIHNQKPKAQTHKNRQKHNKALKNRQKHRPPQKHLTPEQSNALLAETTSDPLHRGKQLISGFLTAILDKTEQNNPTQATYSFINIARPIYNTYRQTKQTPYMDSVVFTAPINGPNNHQEQIDQQLKEWETPPRRIKKLTRRIAALRAIRTMKINGQLPK